MVLQADDELLSYIYRFTSNITDAMQTTFMGVHPIFKQINS